MLNIKNSPNFFAKLYRTLQSVFAAMFGVQSQNNMQKDFEQGHIIYYVLTGIIVLLLLLFLLYFIVKSLI